MGTLSRDQRAVRKTLDPHDLMIVLGADVLRMSVWSEVDPLPEKMAILQIGLIDWEMGKNYPAEQAVYGDLRESLPLLTTLLRESGGGKLNNQSKIKLSNLKQKNWSSKRVRMITEIESEPLSSKMSPDLFTLSLVNSLPKDTIVVHEGLTSTTHLTDLLAYTDRFSFHGFGSGFSFLFLRIV